MPYWWHTGCSILKWTSVAPTFRIKFFPNWWLCWQNLLVIKSLLPVTTQNYSLGQTSLKWLSAILKREHEQFEKVWVTTKDFTMVLEWYNRFKFDGNFIMFFHAWWNYWRYDEILLKFLRMVTESTITRKLELMLAL